MARSDERGNGDRCPLLPIHGKMFVIDSDHGVKKQYCPHVMHDGLSHGPNAAPASRNIWPLYGLEDTLATYLARLDQAVRKADLPDLSDLTLEV